MKSKLILLILSFLQFSCITTEIKENKNTKVEENRKRLTYEQSLIYPQNLLDARNILKEGEGVFKDALLIFEGKGTAEDAKFLEVFLVRMKKDPQLFKAANQGTLNNKGFESDCLRVIKILKSPNLEKHQYEFGLIHVTNLDQARNVFKEGRGDFQLAAYLLEEDGVKEDVALLEETIKRIQNNEDFKKLIHKNYDKNAIEKIEKVIAKIESRQTKK